MMELITGCSATSEKEPLAPPDAPAEPSAKPKVAGAKVAPKAITASNSRPGDAPALVSDDNPETGWNAGGVAPQWIQLDLGEAINISTVLLNADQYPAGATTHEIYGGATPENMKLLGTLNGETKAKEWIEFKTTATGIRYLKVVTLKSPSWVAWHEIEVYN
jgi:hypothetical protein